MPYQHILAAIDLTDESGQVLTKAQQVAKQHGAKLSLVTVIKPLAHVYGGLDMAPIASGTISFEQEAIEQSKKDLNARAAEIGVAPEDAHVLLGGPAQEIRQSARTLGADLIVIGTHGRHGMGLLLGSTANGVLHGVECDTLVVRIDSDDD